MKNAKKILTLLLVTVMSFALLAACGTKSAETAPNAAESASANAAAAATNAEPAATNAEPQATTITDYAGNTFASDKPVNTVMAIHPIYTMLALRLAPDKVVSVDKIFTQQYLNDNGLIALLSNLGADHIKSLPVTNTFMQKVDPEQVLNLNPDLVVTLDKDSNAKSLQDATRKPFLIVSKNTLADYAKSFRMLGAVLGNSQEADQMADYWEKIIAGVKEKTDPITAENRPNVYHTANGSIYATVGKDTIMASVVKLAGGNNLGDQVSDDSNGTNENIEVSMDQILQWNPDVVVANNSAQYQEIMNSPEWKAVNAVKNGKVYCQLKYSFADGLTSLPGLLWYNTVLTNPDDTAALDAYHQEAKNYFQLFYKYSISDDELNQKR